MEVLELIEGLLEKNGVKCTPNGSRQPKGEVLYCCPTALE